MGAPARIETDPAANEVLEFIALDGYTPPVEALRGVLDVLVQQVGQRSERPAS